MYVLTPELSSVACTCIILWLYFCLLCRHGMQLVSTCPALTARQYTMGYIEPYIVFSLYACKIMREKLQSEWV